MNASRTTFRLGYINNDRQYLLSLDRGPANALFAFAYILTGILAGFILVFLKWLLHLYPGIGPQPNRLLAAGDKKPNDALKTDFVIMAASHRGCWQLFFDAITLCDSNNGKRSLSWSIGSLFDSKNRNRFLRWRFIILFFFMAIIYTGSLYALNFSLASSNQGAYSIFRPDFSVAPFNWSAGASNSISAAVEHIARGSDYDPFDGWARNISLVLGQAVAAVGFANDLGLNVSKQAGCWFGDQFCLDGTIGNLTMHFRVDTSQIGVLSLKKVSIEGRSMCSEVEVDEVMAQTSQQYSNDNMTAIDSFQFGSLSQNGSITPVSWSTFSALSTTHDTDSTTFWADASGRPGNYSFPEGFNLVDAHLTLIFLPATILPSINGSGVNSIFGEWPFRYGNITQAYNKPRLLACRDDSRMCVGNDCTPFGGYDQVRPAAEGLFRRTGIPRDFVFLSTHAADGMVSGPVRLLRNKALMVNDFVAEGNTLDVSSYAIPEVVRWFALSASATAALPGRIASGYFARKWVLSGVTGGTTPPVTGDSIGGTDVDSVVNHRAKELSRITIGVDQQRQLVNILPILLIGVFYLVISLAQVLIYFASLRYESDFIKRWMILDPFTDLEILGKLVELVQNHHVGPPTADQAIRLNSFSPQIDSNQLARTNTV